MGLPAMACGDALLPWRLKCVLVFHVGHDTAWEEPASRDDCVQCSLPCVAVGDGGLATETIAAKEDRSSAAPWGKPLDCFAPAET